MPNSLKGLIPAVFVVTKLVGHKLMEQGAALSAAIVKRDGKYLYHFRLTTWDARNKHILTSDKEIDSGDTDKDESGDVGEGE